MNAASKIALALAGAGIASGCVLAWRLEPREAALTAGALAAALTGAGAYLYFTIARPLKDLARQWERDEPPPGLTRADEIGLIARLAAEQRDEWRRRLSAAEAEDAAQRRVEVEAAAREAEAQVAAKFGVLNALTEALKAVASGDLTARLVGNAALAIPPIAQRFDQAVALFAKAMLAFAASTGAIRVQRREIGDAIDELRRCNEDHANELAATATELGSLRQAVAASVAEVVEARVGYAAILVGVADGAATAKQGADALMAMASTSKDVAGVAGLIDEVAFQTSLLALNAGVEAARAGEAGRGIAVVAQEMRALADRSTKAAKELNVMLTRIFAGARRDSDALVRASEKLEALGPKAREIGSRLEAAAQSARPATSELEAVGEKLARIAKTLGNETAASEEARRANDSLEALVGKLTALIEHFRFDRPGALFESDEAPEETPPATLSLPAPAQRALAPMRRRASGDGL
jgi:methyl-accepting chemotaxis protein